MAQLVGIRLLRRLIFGGNCAINPNTHNPRPDILLKPITFQDCCGHDQIEARLGFLLDGTRLSHSYKTTNVADVSRVINRLHHFLALQHVVIFLVNPEIFSPLYSGERVQSAPQP